MPLNIITVDDEPEALQNLKLLIAEQSNCQLMRSCDNGITAIETIRQLQPDLVFLDIQMPEISGFEVIKAVQPFYTPLYIFTTAYDQYAINAFEVNALDYLLKPYDDSRFHLALEKAKQQILYKQTNGLSSKLDALLKRMDTVTTPRFIKRIPIKSAHRIYFIEVARIMFFQAENQYVNIFLMDGTTHLIRDAMNRLEMVLDPGIFFRCHRSSIVNINEIQQIAPHFKGDFRLTLKRGMVLKLSKTRKQALKHLMGW